MEGERKKIGKNVTCNVTETTRQDIQGKRKEKKRGEKKVALKVKVVEREENKFSLIKCQTII